MRTITSYLPALLLPLAACSGSDNATQDMGAQDPELQDLGEMEGLPETNMTAAGSNITPSSASGSDAQWFSKPVAGDPAALYGPPNTEARFSIRCDAAADQLVLTRSMRVMNDAVLDMVVDTGSAQGSLTATSRLGPMPRVTARMTATDKLAAALMDAKGEISITVDGDTLRIPADPAMRSVIETCA